ncbi:class A beta-lactamase [Azonexus sp.]|uniref:class A beta-lactamase n=1 Tax=Azonexus sp. TaxID=1872668 RepID=UPI0035B1811A
MSRRRFLRTLSAIGLIAAAPRAALANGSVTDRLRALEAAVGGRLGVHIIDTATGDSVGYRADERFMLLSSFKVLAGAYVLQRVDAGLDRLDRRIVFDRSALLPWSPVTEKFADGQGMTLGELCAATIATSDNAAANLILDSFAGPPALTAFLRGSGDDVTRLDRREPELNQPGADPDFDTTTPRSMATTLQRLLLGDLLSPASRRQLQDWLLACVTGERRLKAGLPADWRIGDKTGSNRSDASDVGIVWPPGRPPLLVAAYLSDSPAEPAACEACLAGVGKILADFVTGS